MNDEAGKEVCRRLNKNHQVKGALCDYGIKTSHWGLKKPQTTGALLLSGTSGRCFLGIENDFPPSGSVVL